MATKPLLIAIAEAVSGWFPDLGGRSIAVSEVDPFNNKTNIPTLPLAITALVNEEGEQGQHGGGNINLTQDLLIQFIYEPVRYNRQDGAATPFFAYYDYEGLRDRLLTFMHDWRTPRNGGIQYRSMNVESDEFAVYISFRFRTTERWCPLPELCEQPYTVQIVYNVCIPSGFCQEEQEEETDPCAFALN